MLAAREAAVVPTAEKTAWLVQSTSFNHLFNTGISRRSRRRLARPASLPVKLMFIPATDLLRANNWSVQGCRSTG
jgi:hypothetical protein